jgi:hypothetical protein
MSQILGVLTLMYLAILAVIVIVWRELFSNREDKLRERNLLGYPLSRWVNLAVVILLVWAVCEFIGWLMARP